MNTRTNDPGDSAGAADREVGSLGVEAARLLHALEGWAEASGHDAAAAAASAATSAAAAARETLHDVDGHLATGSAECQYCPVCQVISAVRATSPEVRAHLRSAAGSLMQAAAALLAPPMAGPVPRREDRRRDGAVQRIDVRDDRWDDERDDERDDEWEDD